MSTLISKLRKGNNFRSNKRATSDIKESPEFKKRLAFLRKSEFWTHKQMDEYQSKELRRIVSYVYEQIPYYRELFEREGITPKDIQTLDDLKKIPVLTRAIIKQNYDKLLPLGIDAKKLLYRTTGGSTGDPLVIFSDMNFVSRDRANTLYYLGVAGFSPYKFKSVRLYGDKIPEHLLTKGIYWYKNKKTQLILSCFHISNETIRSYVKAIENFGPVYIHSRPSAIYSLALHMKENNLSLKKPIKAIFCDGEILYDKQQKLIEDVFLCRVFNTYGHTEGAAVGISCKESRLLHFLPQVGILELLDSKGKKVFKEGARGEMVVTGFNNDIFPLIRYKTEDAAIATTKKCSCGRPYMMVKSVEGRMQDYVVDRKGHAVPLAPAIFNYNDMDWSGINRFKIEQKVPGKLEFLVQLEPSFKDSKIALEKRLRSKLPPIFGGEFSISVKIVDDITFSAIGKHRYLAQHLKVDPLK
jgi:phenylacetate-CoA ligase